MKRFLGTFMQYAGPIGVWVVVLALVGDLIVGAVMVQVSRDTMQNEQEIAAKTNAFLQRIEDEEINRLSGDSEYIKEFRNAVNTLYQAEQKRLSGDSEYIKEFRSTVDRRNEFQSTVLLYLDRLEQLLVGRVAPDYPFVKPKPQPEPEK